MADQPADSTSVASQGADPLLAAVGTRIARVRSGKDIGVTRAAAAAGMNKGHWWRIEAGEHNLSLKVLARVAAALDTEMSDLLAGVAVPPTEAAPKSRPKPQDRPAGKAKGRLAGAPTLAGRGAASGAAARTATKRTRRPPGADPDAP